MKPLDFVVLLLGAALIVLGCAFATYADEELPYIDEQCMRSFGCALGNPTTVVVWDLMYGDEVLAGNLTQEKCEEIANDLNANTPTYVSCRARLVERHNT